MADYYEDQISQVPVVLPVIGANTIYAPAYSASFGTIADSQVYQRQVGDKRHISGRFTVGTTTSSLATLGLPNSESVAVGGGTAQRWAVGRWTSNLNTLNAPKSGTILALPGDAFLTFGLDDYASATVGLNPLNANNMFVAGEILSIIGEVIVPTTALVGQNSQAYGAGQATADKSGLLAYSHRFQTKFLPNSPTMPSAETVLPGLTFNNLTVGRVYRYSGLLYLSVNTANQPCIIKFRSGSGVSGTILGQAVFNIQGSAGASIFHLNGLFTATSTVFQATYSGAGSTSGQIQGSGLRDQSYVQLEELSATEVTTWT